MLTKNEIKQIRALHLKKGREEQGCFVCEGNKLVSELLSSSFRVREVLATHQWQSEHPDVSEVRTISSQEMEKISQMSTAPGVLAIAEIKNFALPGKEELKKELFFVLDKIKDPGNLGTIIRIADWFGVKSVICSEDTVELLNHKTVQASMGSVFRVPVHYLPLKSFVSDCMKEEIPLFAAVMDGNKEVKIISGGIILGSESHGISQEILDLNPQKITIPSFGEAESLNVAVAAGILVAKVKW